MHIVGDNIILTKFETSTKSNSRIVLSLCVTLLYLVNFNAQYIYLEHLRINQQEAFELWLQPIADFFFQLNNLQGAEGEQNLAYFKLLFACLFLKQHFLLSPLRMKSMSRPVFATTSETNQSNMRSMSCFNALNFLTCTSSCNAFQNVDFKHEYRR